MEPYRLKSRKIVDLISGSLVNPFFRYYSGLAVLVPVGILMTRFSPILPIIFVVGIQFGGYSLYRLYSKKHDLKLKMNSTVAKISEKKIKIMAYSALGFSVLSYFGMLVNDLTIQNSFLGYIPIKFGAAIILVALFLPILKDGVLHPKKANMKVMYRRLYVMNVVFVIGTLIIIIFFS